MTVGYKNYHGSVFAQKKARWNGMDQSKGQLYSDDHVEMTLNLNSVDNVLSVREGMERVESSVVPVTGGRITSIGITLTKGSKVFFASEYGEL